MNIPDFEAEPRYEPFRDRATAVTAPVDASSEKVADRDQSFREIMAISMKLVQ